MLDEFNSNEYDEGEEPLFKTMKEMEDYIKTLQKEPVKLDFSYSMNYKPKKIINDDNVLKFSIAKNDKRYWSTKEHILKAELNYGGDKSKESNFK